MAEAIKTYEDQLPTWQRWTNGFLENWIFAFIVAMVVRQFFLEPFVIPTASMEPMLLGSQYFTKADHVVVNKLTHRFTDAERWDVTVFEFPIPEIYNAQEKRENQIWGLGSDRVESNWLTQPLQHRNFVKRLVILPGDEFFVSGGDIYIKQGETFDVARKPADIQAALWQCMYEHGVEEGYKPWSMGSDIRDGKIVIKPSQRAVSFTQPLNNLYMKPGIYRVHPIQNSSDSLNVEISMLNPLFQFKNKKGNAWDLDRWAIYRLNSLEIDSQEHGAKLNRRMSEHIGDVRIRFQPSALSGSISLEVFDRDKNKYVVQMTASDWRVIKEMAGAEQQVLFSGKESVIGTACSFIRIDNQVWFEMDGKEMHERISCQRPQNPDAPLLIRWSGSGQIELDSCALDRDVHYCRSGFLADLAQEEQQTSREIVALEQMKQRQERAKAAPEVLKTLDNAISDAHAYFAGLQSTRDVHELIRSRLLGRPLANDRERYKPLGDGPYNTLTAPEGAYLLFGDNSPFSWDSRNWGWVPERNIRGRAAWVINRLSSIR